MPPYAQLKKWEGGQHHKCQRFIKICQGVESVTKNVPFFLPHVWDKWQWQLPGMVQVTLKSPPKSFPTFPSIDSFHWSSWRRKDCHDCHDGWCFISSISIYIGILKRLRHYLVTSPNKNPMYCFKVLVVCMVWSFHDFHDAQSWSQ